MFVTRDPLHRPDPLRIAMIADLPLHDASADDGMLSLVVVVTSLSYIPESDKTLHALSVLRHRIRIREENTRGNHMLNFVCVDFPGSRQANKQVFSDEM